MCSIINEYDDNFWCIIIIQSHRHVLNLLQILVEKSAP